MLGFNDGRQVVQEPFATEMREALKRAQSGEMNDVEQECEQRLSKARHQYSFTWL